VLSRTPAPRLLEGPALFPCTSNPRIVGEYADATSREAAIPPGGPDLPLRGRGAPGTPPPPVRCSAQKGRTGRGSSRRDLGSGVEGGERAAPDTSAGRGPRSVDPVAPADVLMEGILDKLRLLGYEEQFCRQAAPPKPPLHSFSFATPHTSPQEQTMAYYYMVDLSFWLLQQCGLGPDRIPDAVDETPNVVLGAILSALKAGGFSATGLTLQKLQKASGDDVCGLLDALTDSALEVQGFRFDDPVRSAEDAGDEMEVVNQAEEETEEEEVEEGEGRGDIDESLLDAHATPGKVLPGLGKRGQGELPRDGAGAPSVPRPAQ